MDFFLPSLTRWIHICVVNFLLCEAKKKHQNFHHNKREFSSSFSVYVSCIYIDRLLKKFLFYLFDLILVILRWKLYNRIEQNGNDVKNVMSRRTIRLYVKDILAKLHREKNCNETIVNILRECDCRFSKNCRLRWMRQNEGQFCDTSLTHEWVCKLLALVNVVAYHSPSARICTLYTCQYNSFQSEQLTYK